MKSLALCAAPLIVALAVAQPADAAAVAWENYGRTPIYLSMRMNIDGLGEFTTLATSQNLPDALFGFGSGSGKIDTEIVTMDFVASTPFGADMRVRIGDANGDLVNLPASLGTFDWSTGHSFFDLFFEATIPDEGTFYNPTALQIAAKIDPPEFPPPVGTRYSSVNTASLCDLDGNEVGIIEELAFLLESSEDVPSIPSEGSSGLFRFVDVISGNWYDPPITYGYRYVMESPGSKFTDILGFPSGFADPFTVAAGGTELGTFRAGDSLVFPDEGVTEFLVTGINPLVDPSDPTAFPLQLAFSTQTATFRMEALSIPEPSAFGIWLVLAGVAACLVWRRQRKPG